MGNKLKGIFIGIIIGVIISATTTFALNGSLQKVLEYRDIKICVDGERIIPTDADGNYVEPFIIDGTTYLPVRAVANAFGKDVSWDGNTHTVYIEENEEDIKSLVVGTNAEFPPFEHYENGKMTGFDIDFINFMCDELGYEIEIVDMEFDSLIPALVNGDVDLIIAGISVTDERDLVVDFSIPYITYTYDSDGDKYTDSYSIAVRENDPIIKEINDCIDVFKHNGAIDNIAKKWGITIE